MRNWSLSQGDPLYLTLAADSRFTTPDYGNDHIWELEMGTGEPRVLAVHTTYGLRARSMRIFPRFTEAKRSISDPGLFPSPPRIRRYYPNFLTVDFVPLESLLVSAEYWIPESHALSGRITLINESTKTRQIVLEVCGILAALDGRGLTPIQQQMVNVLAGQTSGITPVIFMTGGARHGSGPNPSLQLEVELGPGARRTLGFAQAALAEIPASFELARHAAARNWEAERARIELQNDSDVIDIHTGDPAWDAAFDFSQKAALGLFFRGNQHLPQPSFVLTRQPDHGFSHRLDGSDYPPIWNGQPIHESLYLADVLRGRPQIVKGLVLNYLTSQTETGELDHKPGLAGQRARLQAAPLLASLVWSYFEATGDLPFLQETYPKLMDFLRSWFESTHDRDRNGVPEWDHPLQTGFEDNPLFDVWHPWSQGLDISTVHSPALNSMLYREARSLIDILHELNRLRREKPGDGESKPAESEGTQTDAQKKDLAWLETLRRRLVTQVEESWDDQSGLYTYRDRDTGLVQHSRLVAERLGSGEMRQPILLDQPARLMLVVQTESASTTRPVVELSENETQGLTETIDAQRFHLRSGGLIATSMRIYRQLGRFKVAGLGEADRIFIRTANTLGEDLTRALPLWAQIPEPARAARIIQENILDGKRFASAFGLAALHHTAELTPTSLGAAQRGIRAAGEAEGVGMSVHLPWNAMIAAGLLSYGHRQDAADLITRFMKAVVQNLKNTHSFFQKYHAENGTGMGERNLVSGLAPVGLFMNVLGVKNISSRSVQLEGRNPFPWPVTINYRGVTVLRGLDRTVITFPNAKNIIVEDSAPCIVRM